MRIGIDCRSLSGQRLGVDNYRYFLTQAMLAEPRGHEIVFFTDQTGLPPELKVLDIETATINLPLFIWETLGVPGEASRRGIDLFHFHRHHIPYRRPFRTVTTVHDIAYYFFPQMFRLRRRLLLKHMIAHAVRVADRIIVHSDSARNDLQHLLKVPSQKIVKILSGYDPEFTSENSHSERVERLFQNMNLRKGFILSVGALQPRKNLMRLLDAYAGLDRNLKEQYALLLIGGNEGKAPALREKCRVLGIEDHVILPGFLPAQELRDIYRRATCYMFPSLYEGYGFPLLEAMVSGCPVGAAKVSSLPEVGGDAVLYFDPNDTQDMQKVLQRLLTDKPLREQLREKGLQRAQLFSWTQAAKATMELFEEIIEGVPRTL